MVCSVKNKATVRHQSSTCRCTLLALIPVQPLDTSAAAPCGHILTFYSTSSLPVGHRTRRPGCVGHEKVLESARFSSLDSLLCIQNTETTTSKRIEKPIVRT